MQTAVLRPAGLGCWFGCTEGCKVLSHEGDLTKAMKLCFRFAVMLMLFAVTAAFAAPVGVATMNSVYSFQVIGVSPQWGYYNGSTWVNVNGNCPNPQTKGGCSNLSFAKITVGTLFFDRKGHAKFLR